MKKQILIAITVLLISIRLYGQDDHLKKVDFNAFKGGLKEYYDTIFPLLYEGLSDTPLARYTVFSSFTSEYVLSVEKDPSGKYELVFRKCSESYWYAENKQKVSVIESRKVIDPELAMLVHELFKAATSTIREPEGMIMGLDGISYYFSTTDPDKNIITGETWSPDKGTKMEKLVSVCNRLVKMMKKEPKDTSKLKREIKKFITELEE